MFKNLTKKEKELKFKELLTFAGKIQNKKLKTTCSRILKDYKKDLLCRSAGHDGVEGITENVRTHHNFDGGWLTTL